MPPRGAPARAEQLATLGRIAHEKFISPEIGRLLDELERFEAEHDHDSFEASLIRVTRARLREGAQGADRAAGRDGAVRPRSRSRSGSRRARTTTSRAFLPALRQNLELRRRYVACFEGDFAEPYDALLDDYERGMTAAEVRTLFDYLKEHQAPLVQQLAGAERRGAGRRAGVPDRAAEGSSSSRSCAASASTRRRGGSTRPCTRSRSRRRAARTSAITTRYFDDSLDGLFATMHETGHGLYEHQVDRALDRTPLGARRLARHARVAEPDVGEPRRPLAAVLALLLPAAASRLFPEALAGYDVERWYREINAVEPLADPGRGRRGDLQPPHHPPLRARAGAARRVVPARAAARGVEPAHVGLPRDRGAGRHRAASSRTPTGRSARSATSPTYALGNLISAQLWERITAELPDLERAVRARRVRRRCASGCASTCTATGGSSRPRETLERAIGSRTIDPEPYVRYLREKIGAIYGLPVAAG